MLKKFPKYRIYRLRSGNFQAISLCYEDREIELGIFSTETIAQDVCSRNYLSLYDQNSVEELVAEGVLVEGHKGLCWVL